MYSIKGVLMTRDKMTAAEAEERIAEGRRQFENGGDPEEILEYEFGLEPDYIYDLLDYSTKK